MPCCRSIYIWLLVNWSDVALLRGQFNKQTLGTEFLRMPAHQFDNILGLKRDKTASQGMLMQLHVAYAVRNGELDTATPQSCSLTLSVMIFGPRI